MTIAAVRLNHAVLFVSDLARSVQFWTDAFGMQVVVREPRANAAFLRLPRSGNHHDLGLFGLGAGAAPKHAGGVGLYHLAWQVDTVEELEEAPAHSAAPRRLHRRVQPRRHEEHVRCRSGRQRVRGMWMLPREDWGIYEDTAPVDVLDLAAELRRWRGIGTAGRLTTGPAETRS